MRTTPPLALLALAAAAAAAAPAAAQTLLGSGDLRSGCATSTVFAQTEYVLSLRPAPQLFSLQITTQNTGELEGTYVVDASSGAVFTQAVELLTNGVADQVVTTTLYGGGGCQGATNSEAIYWDITGLACPNGIDFEGSEIQRIEMRVDSVCFGPKGPYGAKLVLDGTLSVYGRDLAPCVPPRFHVRLQRGSSTAALRGAPEPSGPVRLWVDHAAFVPDAVADLVLVSTRPLELRLAGGILLADPADAALVLRRAVAPGQEVGLRLPPEAAAVPLFAQAVSLDAAGRPHPTNALELPSPR